MYEKIEKVQVKMDHLNAIGASDHWLYKLNVKWLNNAKELLVKMDTKIQIEEMKQA